MLTALNEADKILNGVVPADPSTAAAKAQGLALVVIARQLVVIGERLERIARLQEITS